MKQYILTRDHEMMGVMYHAGAVIEISLDHIAANLMSDHEGLLVPILGNNEPPAVRVVEQAPHDRQVKAAKSKR
jgi:hypothetical protein